MGLVRKFKANFHSFEDVLLFVRILLLIAVLPLLIRFLTLPQLMKALTWHVPGSSGNRAKEVDGEKVMRFADYLLTRNFWIYRNTCLKRSLVLYHFLHALVPGIHICFGVRLKKDAPVQERKNGLEGHAWLMHKGEIIPDGDPDPTSTYAVTYCFPERFSGTKTHE